MQKLSGKAAMLYGIVDCGEINKNITSLLFSRVAILNFLTLKSNLIYG